MILGIGTDIIEVARVNNALVKAEFKQKIFTPSEIAYCEKDKSGQRYAARYAAKEAFFKALGTGWADGMTITEVEIMNDEAGKPRVQLNGKTLEIFEAKGAAQIHLSLAHIKETALAFVVIESL